MAITDKLAAVADAIRGKTGKAELMTLDQMPGEIEGIQTCCVIDPNNLLSGLAWHVGRVRAEDGTIEDTNTNFCYTDVFDISGFIGTMMFTKYDCNFPQYSL